MRKLTVLVDMDDTVENLVEAWVEYLNNMYGVSVDTEDVVDWNICKAFPTLSSNEVYAPLLEDEMWKTVKPKDGAQKYLGKLLNDGHRIYIVTTSSYKALNAKMEHVLFKYFPFITWNDVIITSNKQLINGDVLIDDGVHNLEGGSYYRILMNANHNKAYNAEANGMVRAFSWKEVYLLVSGLANRKCEHYGNVLDYYIYCKNGFETNGCVGCKLDGFSDYAREG